MDRMYGTPIRGENRIRDAYSVGQTSQNLPGTSRIGNSNAKIALEEMFLVFAQVNWTLGPVSDNPRQWYP